MCSNSYFCSYSQRSRIQVWLYEQVNMRIEGCIIVGFCFSPILCQIFKCRIRPILNSGLFAQEHNFESLNVGKKKLNQFRTSLLCWKEYIWINDNFSKSAKSEQTPVWTKVSGVSWVHWAVSSSACTFKRAQIFSVVKRSSVVLV